MVTSHHTHHKIKRTVNWFLIILVAIFVAFLVQVFRTPADRLAKMVANPSTRNIELHLRHLKIKAELARTDSERSHGLSDRNSLSEFAGLLFVFPEPSKPSFWMKDTNFPLDIIWIDKRLKIVGIEKNVAPDSYPDTFSPPSPIRYVLEVNGGLTDNFNINPGDDVGI